MTAIYRLISFFRRLCPNLQFSLGRTVSLLTERSVVHRNGRLLADSVEQLRFTRVRRGYRPFWEMKFFPGERVAKTNEVFASNRSSSRAQFVSGIFEVTRIFTKFYDH